MKLIHIQTGQEAKRGDCVRLRGENLKLKIENWFSHSQLSSELQKVFPTGLVYLYNHNHMLDYYKPESWGLRFK